MYSSPLPDRNGDVEVHGVDRVPAGALAHPRRVVRDRLRVPFHGAQAVLQRKRWPCGPARPREVLLGRDRQLGGLAVARAAVPGRAQTVHLAQEPADPEVVAERTGAQLDRPLSHAPQGLGGQQSPPRPSVVGRCGPLLTAR
ncbi:hypothetical protein [Streptomyces nojiriensis]|uniref:hypothetical protein n=1 Tax=Streptomyces nojiriensis TaxID=66374 RepID=UPI0035DC86CE